MKNDNEFKTLVVLWGGSCDIFHTFDSPMLNPAHPHKNLTLNKIDSELWIRTLSGREVFLTENEMKEKSGVFQHTERNENM